MRWRKCREEQIRTTFHYDKIREKEAWKNAVPLFFCRAARRVNIPNFLDFIFYSTLLNLHNIIDGRETAATIRLSVGSEVAGRARGVRNHVHVW